MSPRANGVDVQAGRIPGGTGLLACLLPALVSVILSGCAGGGAGTELRPATGNVPRLGVEEQVIPERLPGDEPYGLQFVTVHENDRNAPYFPLEGPAGVAFGDDGTLYLCDELGGRIHGWDQARDLWFQFNVPGGRYARPVDVQVDQFTVYVLDMDGRELQRYDLDGVLLDRPIDFRYLDPSYDRLPSAFDIDVDGGMVFCDGQEDQVVRIDGLHDLRPPVGGTGTFQEQFRDPSGVVFLLDGTFVVADRGNRRLQHFNRLGSFLAEVGGQFDVDNPMLTPQGMDRDDAGNVYVADPAAGAVHVFDPALNHLFSADSSLGLRQGPQGPIDVAVSEGGLLAVSDRTRQAVILYRILYR